MERRSPTRHLLRIQIHGKRRFGNRRSDSRVTVRWQYPRLGVPSPERRSPTRHTLTLLLKRGLESPRNSQTRMSALRSAGFPACGLWRLSSRQYRKKFPDPSWNRIGRFRLQTQYIHRRQRMAFGIKEGIGVGSAPAVGVSRNVSRLRMPVVGADAAAFLDRPDEVGQELFLPGGCLRPDHVFGGGGRQAGVAGRIAGFHNHHVLAVTPGGLAKIVTDIFERAMPRSEEHT